MNKRFFALLLALLILCSPLCPSVFAAASAKASITLSDSKITVGDTVTVTVQYRSDAEIGSYDFLLNYDAALLQYVSGADSETGNGKLPFVNYNENSDPKLVKRSVKFKAIATGSAAFSTQTKAIVNNDFSLMSVSEADASLTVNPKQTASSDNALKSISVSGGSFAPDFSPSQTKYSMEVDYSVKKLTVSAVANHSKAKVSVSGTDLELGENTVKITVTAENGSKKTYTLKVTRKESQFANVSTVLDGNAYVFAHDPDALTPPQGFTASSALFEEKSVLSFVSADGFFTLVWLTPIQAPPLSSAPASSAPASSATASSSAETPEEPAQTQPAPVVLPPREGWYMLLSDQTTLLPYTPLVSPDTEYVPIPIPTDVSLPEGCESAYALIHGEEIRAYRNEYCVNNDLYLVYARSSAGTSGFFYWHRESGCFYPYLRPETVTVTVLVTEPAPLTSSAAPAGATPLPQEPSLWQVTDAKLSIFSLVATVLLLVLLAILIPLAVRHGKTKKELLRLQAAPKRKRASRDPASHFLHKPELSPSELLTAANQPDPSDPDE